MQYDIVFLSIYDNYMELAEFWGTKIDFSVLHHFMVLILLLPGQILDFIFQNSNPFYP